MFVAYQTYGPIKIFGYEKDTILDVFLSEGYTSTILQINKPGQKFGLIKEMDNDLENHIRFFIDNSFESEIELSREYLEHPFDCKSYYEPLFDIFNRYNIPFQIMRSIPADPIEIMVPFKKTRWKPLVIPALAICTGLYLTRSR